MPRFRQKRAKPSVITLADRARDAGQWEVAAEHYRDALHRKPQNPPIWVQYGHVLKESGHLAEAEKAYRTALAYDPRIADSHLQLGHVLKIQDKKEEARAAYLRAIALDPSLNGASLEFAQLGWSETHLSELRCMLAREIADPAMLASMNGESVEHSLTSARHGRHTRYGQDGFTSYHSAENSPTIIVESPGQMASPPLASAELEVLS
jgi:tetratricopeptide (TPR) repeat protein